MEHYENTQDGVQHMTVHSHVTVLQDRQGKDVAQLPFCEASGNVLSAMSACGMQGAGLQWAAASHHMSGDNNQQSIGTA